MKIITKAQLISQFGERNAAIMWQRRVQQQAGQNAIAAMMADAKERREKSRLKAYKPKTVLTGPSEPQGDFAGRIQKIEEDFQSGKRHIGDKIAMALPHNVKDGE